MRDPESVFLDVPEPLDSFPDPELHEVIDHAGWDVQPYQVILFVIAIVMLVASMWGELP